MSYRIICEPSTHTYEIKRSQFIAFACHAKARAQALDSIKQQQTLYPDARHHCWSYLIGDPKQASAMAMSDDGEPSGTAGKPMLNVLQHGEIGDVLVVISRYFGGIKLGAGGLVRAYSHATQEVLKHVNSIQQIPMRSGKIVCSFAQEQYLRHALTKLKADVLINQYSESVMLHVKLPAEHSSDLIAICKSHQFTLKFDD